jgi:hypothetical protein
MKRMSWRSQLANGRVFELRSQSKRFPAPCGLVIDDQAGNWGGHPMLAPVDQYGVLGHGLYERFHNPNIYVAGIVRDQFTSARILRRRRDLERFDADDLALIRYGYALDFSGKIHGSYSYVNIPSIVPCAWFVFWLAAWDDDDWRWVDRNPKLERLLHGAWHLESHGGSRRRGYKYGHVWVTRHTGTRLEQIRKCLRSCWGSRLIEQPVTVARWTEGENVYTEEIRRECPPLGSRACLVQTPHGIQGIYR